MERAAVTEFAFDADLAAHHFHQPFGDRQAQSGAAVAARGGSVGLPERFEDHGCCDPVMPIPESATVKRSMACGRSHQFDQPRQADEYPRGVNLIALFTRFSSTWRSADRIARSHVAGHRWRLRGAIPGLCCAPPVQRPQRFSRPAPRSNGDRHSSIFPASILEKSRMSLRMCSSVSAEAARSFQIIPLFGVERRFQNHVHHAHQAVHRRADFMAHVGQEFALQAAGLFGAFLRFGQLSRALLTLISRSGKHFAPVRRLSRSRSETASCNCAVGFVQPKRHPVEILHQLRQFERRIGGKRGWIAGPGRRIADRRRAPPSPPRGGKFGAHPARADGRADQSEQHPAGGEQVIIGGLRQDHG